MAMAESTKKKMNDFLPNVPKREKVQDVPSPKLLGFEREMEIFVAAAGENNVPLDIRVLDYNRMVILSGTQVTESFQVNYKTWLMVDSQVIFPHLFFAVENARKDFEERK